MFYGRDVVGMVGGLEGWYCISQRTGDDGKLREVVARIKGRLKICGM
jgi:hypothetical protein